MVFNILSYVVRFLEIYAIVIFAQVLLSWIMISTPSLYSIHSFLKKITDPYLRFFRLKIFKETRLDFSPFLGIIFLQLLTVLLKKFIVYQKISLGVVLNLIVSFASSIINFILIIALVLLVFRLVLSLLKKDNESYAAILDSIIHYRIYRFWGSIFKLRIIRYTSLLAISSIIILALMTFNVVFIGNFLANFFLYLTI